MDYADFKDHLAVFLWRDTDTVLLDRLDSLITMGNASLSRDLRHERRHVSAALSATSTEVSLPADYYSIRSLANVDQKLGEFNYAEPSYIEEIRGKALSSVAYPVYSIVNKQLLLVGPMTVSAPLNLVLNYRATVPDFATTDTSWLADTMLDLYTYAVLKHSAPFLREDERVAMWNQLYAEIINNANEESAHEMARGTVQAARPSRQAGVLRKGDRSSSRKLYT